MNAPDHPRSADRSALEQPDRPTWTARQAARYCGVGKSTILRALKAGKFPNAKREDDTWSIPIADLLAAGFHPDRIGKPSADRVDHPRSADRTAPDRTGPPSNEELIDLRDQLQQEKSRREVAEQARDHAQDQVRLLTENLSDLRTTIRMLEASPSATPPPPRDADPGNAAQPEAKRRWWRKG